MPVHQPFLMTGLDTAYKIENSKTKYSKPACYHNAYVRMYVCMYICYTYIICSTTGPYSRKVWRVESLVNLANHWQFTKLKPSKVVGNYL